jgi:hypothetical protein
MIKAQFSEFFLGDKEVIRGRGDMVRFPRVDVAIS